MALGIFEIDALRDDSGNAVVVTGADVEVRNEATGALVALYADIDGNTPLENPFTASGSTIKFYCDYDLLFRVDIDSGDFSRTLRHRAAQKATSEVEEFTPTLTFDTPGDLSVTYARQYGRRVRLGRVVYWEISLAATPSYTTASGAMRIVAELPQPEVNDLLSRPALASAVYHGSTITYPSGRNTIVAGVSGADQITLFGVGDGVSPLSIQTAHVASGVSHAFDLSGMYIAVEA